MLERYFKLKQNGTTIRIEIIAGLTTFLTMSYIMALNPQVLSKTGMDASAVFTATALASIVGTLIMALWAKLPFALAPGVGLNAFFAFTVCLGMGHSWHFALTAVFIEGIIFILLTLFRIREAIIDAIPQALKNAIGAGIGLFISFIGLQNAGIIVNNDATLVKLGDITTGAPLLAFIGLVITSLLLIKKVSGALLLGIFITAIIGAFMGITHYNGIISMPPSVEPLFLKLDFSEIFTVEMAVVVFIFLFVDLFDTLGALVGVATKAGMVSPDGKIKGVKQAFMADAIATTFGALVGTSTTTTYVESATGIAQGGRTGLTSVVTALCFALALFFAPLFLTFTSAITAPVMILVGLFMLPPIAKINFEDYSESIPMFICIIAMPFSYSIAEGISLGMISYVIINLISGNFKKITFGMYILATLFVFKYLI